MYIDIGKIQSLVFSIGKKEKSILTIYPVIRFKYLPFKMMFSEQSLCVSHLSGKIRIQREMPEVEIFALTEFSDTAICFSRIKGTVLNVCNMPSLTTVEY